MRLKAKTGKSFYKFVVAALAVLAAVALTLLIPALGGGGMYFLFLTAIIFSTLYGDERSGGFAIVFSVISNFALLHYLGKPPESFGDWLVLLAFGLAAGFTVFICSAQRKAEAARLVAESKYRMIFEDAITGIYETTVDGRYAAANPKMADMFGYDSPEQMMRTAENLNRRFYVEPDRREEFTRLVEEKETFAGFESEIYRRDGTKIWIAENALAVRDKTGKLVGFQGTTIEITDRKLTEFELRKAREELEEKVVERTSELEKINRVLRGEINERRRIESALRESEEKFRTLVETSTDFIWEVDENAFYTYASPRVRDIIGCEPEEIIGKRPYDLMPPAEAARVKQVVRELAVINEGYTLFESVVIHKDGSLIMTETSSIAVFDETGKARGSRGIARDITGRKRIETELLASQKQLRDLSAHLQTVREEERKDLARELHDELGQLLTALKIETVRLGEKSNSGEKSFAAEQIPAMVAIIDTAMETTRKIVSELRPGVLDELGLVAALEWQTREFQKRTGIRCRLTTEFDEAETCQTLKITVFRILQECLTNVARHSGASQAAITLRDEGSRIFLEVSDDGRGFDEKEIAGSGSFGILGMRERALLLGGTVEIDRSDAGGTRIRLLISRPPELIKHL